MVVWADRKPVEWAYTRIRANYTGQKIFVVFFSKTIAPKNFRYGKGVASLLDIYTEKHVDRGVSYWYSLLTLRPLMSYIYMEHPFLMFLDHTRRTTVGRTPLDE